MGTRREVTLPVNVGGIREGASWGETRDTILSSPMDWSLNWRKDGWRLLIVNIISKTAKFDLNLPEMIVNALIVTLSITIQPVKTPKKTVDVICEDYAGPLRCMVIKPEQIVVPLTLTLGLAVSIEDLGKGRYAGEICGVMLR